MSTASTGEPRPVTRSELAAARRMVRRRGVGDEADDVAQEVVIALARYSRPLAIPSGHTPADARRFVLWGFVRRQVARHLREMRRRARRGGLMEMAEPGVGNGTLERACGAVPSEEDRILERAPLTLLRAAVEELAASAPELRAVLRGYLDGVPMPRVAADLGIPESMAWRRWRLGCEAVRALLRQWAAEEARGAVRMRLDAQKRARATSSRTRAGAEERAA
jgi:DNA-directed RNA polymerase specialized sigma24 family protein